MRRSLIFLFAVFLLFVVAAQETNLTDQEYSRRCLVTSEGFMNFLQQEGFNILRINDTLEEAQVIYDSQWIIERQGRDGKFDFVIDSCDEIEVLHDLAFQSRDDLQVFVSFFEEVIEERMNSESIDAIVLDIEKEINDERYERVEPLIMQAYEEVSNVQEEYSRLNKFYSSTARSFTLIFKEYGYYLGILLVILIVFYLAYRAKIRSVLINKKLQNLRLRKQSLKRIMEDTQKNYFQKGTISESDYQIRNKNFANLIRDIDRQIPLLEEKLIKVKDITKAKEIKNETKEKNRKTRKKKETPKEKRKKKR
jgi:hypothetical protein